jgi:PIN domain nuclease of toxin-antitoxin system
MKNLLDTHTLIWFLNGDKDLSEKARKTIEKGGNLLSIASIWEIAIKVSLGKLDLNASFKDFTDQIAANNIKVLPITIADTNTILNLPFHHKDPFDRIIIAQSLNNELMLISKDGAFASYGLRTIW